MAIAAGLIIWLVTRSGSSSTQPTPPTTAPTTTSASAQPYGPTALNEAGLKVAVGALGQSAFWVGPVAGKTYELQRSANGNVFVRYLPSGVKAGAKHAYPTIGTYPFQNAYTAELALSKRKGWTVIKSAGWFAVYQDAKPTSVFLTAKGFPYQIEVFDPSAAQARALAQSARVTPVR